MRALQHIVRRRRHGSRCETCPESSHSTRTKIAAWPEILRGGRGGGVAPPLSRWPVPATARGHAWGRGGGTAVDGHSWKE